MTDTPDKPDHYNDLSAVERAAWDMLVRGAKDRRHAFHQATVGTVSEEGLPRARTVVLRAADRQERSLRFHTDTRSAKYVELSHRPDCVIHLYDHGAKVQIRARGRARLHSGDALTDGLWREMRDMSKECYRQPVAPGTPLGDPEAAMAGGLLSDEEGYRHFVAAVVSVSEIEWLYLAAAGHRRALLRYEEGEAATWLAP